MAEHMNCSVKSHKIGLLEIVTLESDLLRVTVLAGKGADIHEIIYKPLDMDFLSKGSNPLDSYMDRDLGQNRLISYAECSTGGWQDLLPNRALYKDKEVTLENGGLSATVPWNWEIIESGEDTVSIRLWTDIPELPIRMEKTLLLRNGDPSLYISICAENLGDDEIKHAWVQHCAFGGDFLREGVRVYVPAQTAFQPRKYRDERHKPLADFEEPLDRVTFVSGEQYNIRCVAAPETEDECFFVLDAKIPELALFDHEKNIGISLEWEHSVFPFIRCYYHYVKKDYTVMLEPANDKFADFSDSLQHGTYSILKPGKPAETKIVCKIIAKISEQDT